MCAHLDLLLGCDLLLGYAHGDLLSRLRLHGLAELCETVGEPSGRGADPGRGHQHDFYPVLTHGVGAYRAKTKSRSLAGAWQG